MLGLFRLGFVWGRGSFGVQGVGWFENHGGLDSIVDEVRDLAVYDDLLLCVLD